MEERVGGEGCKTSPLHIRQEYNAEFDIMEQCDKLIKPTTAVGGAQDFWAEKTPLRPDLDNTSVGKR